jgi:hypothetical protein
VLPLPALIDSAPSVQKMPRAHKMMWATTVLRMDSAMSDVPKKGTPSAFHAAAENLADGIPAVLQSCT